MKIPPIPRLFIAVFLLLCIVSTATVLPAPAEAFKLKDLFPPLTPGGKGGPPLPPGLFDPNKKCISDGFGGCLKGTEIGAAGGAAGLFGGLFSGSFSATTPFGGQIYYVTYCTCSGTVLLVVGPPSPAVVVYEPEFSQLYAYYNIWEEGVQVLGNYVEGGGYCAIYAGVTCTTLPNMGVIYQVGTSLYTNTITD